MMGSNRSLFGVTRRKLLVAGGAAAVASNFPKPAISAPVPVRFATGGGSGPGEISTVVFLDWMRQNVLKHAGKEYKPEIIYTRSQSEAAGLLAAGQTDIGALGFTILVAAVRREAVAGGVTVIADIFQDGHPGWASNTFFVRDDSPIKTVADLKGKIVGVVAFGTPLDMALRVVLKKAGLDPKNDVQVVELAFPNIGPALRSKRIDCGSLINPFMANESAKGGLRPLFNYGNAYGNFSVSFQTARTTFLKENDGAVRAYLDDYVRAMKWLYDPANREQALAITAALVKSTPEAISYFLTTKDYYRDVNACISAPLIQGPVDALIDAGLMEGPFDASKYINTSYLPSPC